MSGKKFASNAQDDERTTTDLDPLARRFQMEGLAKTRLSVQTLNRVLLESLIDHGINAVGVSPCFAAPSMRADGSSAAAANELRTVVEDALVAGLVPVLHGDACLYGTRTAGILSGDTLFEILGLAPWATRGVFLTDVAGVYTADPRIHKNATFLPSIGIPAGSSGDGDDVGGKLVLDHDQARDISSSTIAASESLHPQDVTGGFKTKLAAALAVAASGVNVTIAQCGSASAVNAVQGVLDSASTSTVIYRVT